MAASEREDAVLWLAVENEVLRRASRNDRETIAALRAQLHAARRALRTLHAQGGAPAPPGCAGHEQQQHHQCIIAQLSNLDRLALDWARRCEALDGEARELCQLRVEHAQVLEASQALRAAHEAAIRSLQGELASSRDRANHADGQVAALSASRDALTAQVSQLSSRAHALERVCAGLEGGAHALESSVRRIEDGVASLEGAVQSRLQSLQRDVADSRAAQAKHADSRKQRDVQVKHLMKLVRDLEERNGSLSKRIETLEEERATLEVATASATRHLLEKEQVIQHLDRQCAAYEHALKTGKSAHMRQQPSAPLAVSKLANREHLSARAQAHKHAAAAGKGAIQCAGEGSKGAFKTSAARRSHPQLTSSRSSDCKMELEGRGSEKGGETEKACVGAGGAARGAADHQPRSRASTSGLQQAAARPTAVKARSAATRKSAGLSRSANSEHSENAGAAHKQESSTQDQLQSSTQAQLLLSLARGSGGAAETKACAEQDLIRISAADLLLAINAATGLAAADGARGAGGDSAHE